VVVILGDYFFLTEWCSDGHRFSFPIFGCFGPLSLILKGCGVSILRITNGSLGCFLFLFFDGRLVLCFG
jgi:hypothetical protein